MPLGRSRAIFSSALTRRHAEHQTHPLFPANPAEWFRVRGAEFDIRERFQTPVFLMTDLDIAMNDWVTPS